MVGSAFLVGIELAIAELDPVKMLYYSQVFDSTIAPVVVYLLLRITTSRKVMGDFVNGRWRTLIGWTPVAVLVAADLALFASSGGVGVSS